MSESDLCVFERYRAQTEDDLSRAHEKARPVDSMLGGASGQAQGGRGSSCLAFRLPDLTGTERVTLILGCEADTVA